MKSKSNINKQQGFFDLGFSLALIAIFGTTVAIIVPEKEAESSQTVVKAETNHLMKPNKTYTYTYE